MLALLDLHPVLVNQISLVSKITCFAPACTRKDPMAHGETGNLQPGLLFPTCASTPADQPKGQDVAQHEERSGRAHLKKKNYCSVPSPLSPPVAATVPFHGVSRRLQPAPFPKLQPASLFSTLSHPPTTGPRGAAWRKPIGRTTSRALTRSPIALPARTRALPRPQIWKAAALSLSAARRVRQWHIHDIF